MAISEKAFGLEHPDVAIPLTNLAGLFQDQESYEEARFLYERALEIYRKTLGIEHPNAANVFSGIGSLLHAQGSYAESRSMHERALAIRIKLFGSNHPRLAESLHDLAALFQAQDSYAEANPLYKKCLRGTLHHLSLNMGSMTETERFQFLAIQVGPEPLLLNLVAMRGEGPDKD